MARRVFCPAGSNDLKADGKRDDATFEHYVDVAVFGDLGRELDDAGHPDPALEHARLAPSHPAVRMAVPDRPVAHRWALLAVRPAMVFNKATRSEKIGRCWK